MSDQNKDEKTYWLDNPKNVTLICWLIGLVCLGLGAMDFFYHKHGHFSAEELPNFYGFFGFACFFGLVLLGKVLRKLIMRDEGYYDD